MAAKGRAAHGEAIGRAKLTESDIQEIRRRHATGEETQVRLGQEFGVGQSAIWSIVTRRTWMHVKDEETARQDKKEKRT
jgi:hypothetical protein